MYTKKKSLALLMTIIFISILLFNFIADLVFNFTDNIMVERLNRVGISHASLIQSVADFDSLYSEGDYGESAREATLYQIETAFKNLENLTTWYNFAIVSIEKENDYLMTTEFSDWSKSYIYNKLSWLDGVIKLMDEGYSDTIIFKATNSNQYIVDYRRIDELNVGLITYMELKGEKTLKLTVKIIGAILLALIIFLVWLFIIRRYQIKISKLVKANDDLQYTNKFKKQGMWLYDLRNDKFDINKAFIKSLEYDENQINIKTLDDYFSLVHPEDIKELKYLINEILFNKKEYINTTYRFKGLDRYITVNTECYVQDEDNEGYALRIRGINMVINS